MDASCKIQRSIHDVRLTYKYVSRILGTYQISGRLFGLSFLDRTEIDFTASKYNVLSETNVYDNPFNR